MRTRTGATGLSVILLGIFAATPAFALEKWGPFRGQIVDVETGEPIAGAVAIVIWRQQDDPNPVQMKSKFFDAREAVTDADGRFEIPRRPPPFFSFRIFDPGITYFAPGYQPVAEVVTPPDGQPFVAPTVVQMQRLKTKAERIDFQRGLPPTMPASKMPRLLEALNKERMALGLQPIERGDVE